MYSSARDMARFLAANLGALPDNAPLQAAMAFAQQGVFTVGPRFTQALAWQRVKNDGLELVDKNGGPNNTPTYICTVPPRPRRPLLPSHLRGAAAAPRRPPHHLPLPRRPPPARHARP